MKKNLPLRLRPPPPPPSYRSRGRVNGETKTARFSLLSLSLTESSAPLARPHRHFLSRRPRANRLLPIHYTRHAHSLRLSAVSSYHLYTYLRLYDARGAGTTGRVNGGNHALKKRPWGYAPTPDERFRKIYIRFRLIQACADRFRCRGWTYLTFWVCYLQPHNNSGQPGLIQIIIIVLFLFRICFNISIVLVI